MIVAWLAGFAVYEWLAQTQDLGFWTDFLARLEPAGVADRRVAAGLRGRVRARRRRLVRVAAHGSLEPLSRRAGT